MPSWPACAARCRSTAGCRYWTWHNHQSGSWRYLCVTMTGATSKYTLSGTVSGSRDCIGENGSLNYFIYIYNFIFFQKMRRTDPQLQQQLPQQQQTTQTVLRITPCTTRTHCAFGKPRTARLVRGCVKIFRGASSGLGQNITEGAG